MSSILNRKTACPCGGGCPSCQAENLIQPKLSIRAPNDKYEQEADRVAEQVMRMPEPRVQRQVELDVEEEEEAAVQTKPISAEITPLIQRQVEPDEEEEEEPLQAKLLAGEISSLTQRQVEPEEEEEALQAKVGVKSTFDL